MKYSIDPSTMLGAFSIPSDVADKHIKMAGAVQLKVLLLCYRNPFEEIDAVKLSERLSLSVADVNDALRFWVDAGILRSEHTETKAETPAPERPKAVRAATVKPTREEVARRGLESAEITFLLREAEQKLGHALKQSEASTLVWLHDDEGMSVAVLLQVVAFAVSEGRPNISYIEKTALSWLDEGIDDIAMAEQKINEIISARSCWSVVKRAFGLDRKLPGKKEQDFASLWVGERGYDEKLLREAYDRCVDTTSKYSLPYISSILEKWYKAGVKKVADINDEGAPKKTADKNEGSLDTSLYDFMLRAIDDKK